MRVILEGEDGPETIRLKGFAGGPSDHRLSETTMNWRQDVPKNMCESDFEGWLWKKKTSAVTASD